MFPRVQIVEDNLNDFVVLEDKGVCVDTIDGSVSRIGAGGQDRVQGGDLWTDVSCIIDECTVKDDQ